MMNESSSQSWSCGTCTYVNKPMFLLCEMCAQRRPNSGPAPPVRQPSFQSDLDSINGLSHNSSDLGVDLAMIETMDSIIIGSTGLGMDAPTPDATRDNDRAPRRVQRHNSSSRPYLDDDEDGPRGTLIMTDDPANYPSQDGSAYKKTAQELAYEREAERAAMQEAARSPNGSASVPLAADPSMEASISHQQLVCTKRNRNSSTMNGSNQTLPTAHMGSSSTGFSGFDRNSDHEQQQQQQHMDASRNSLANHRRQHRQQQRAVGQPHPLPRQPQHVVSHHHQSLQQQLPAGNGPVIHWSSGRSCASEVSSICSTINSRFDSSCDLSVESDSSSSSSEVTPMAIPRVIPRRVSRPTAAVVTPPPTSTTKRPQAVQVQSPHASSMRNLAVSTTNARPVPRPMKRGTSMATGMSAAAPPPLPIQQLQQSSSPGDVPSKKNHPRRRTTTTMAPAATRGAERLKARAQARANMLNKLSSQQNLGTSTRKLSDRLSSSQTTLLQQESAPDKIQQRTTTTSSSRSKQQQQQPKKRRGIRAVMATMRISAGGGKSRPTN